MQLTMATVAERVAVQEDIVGVHMASLSASPLASPQNSFDHLGTPSRNPRASLGRSGRSSDTDTPRLVPAEDRLDGGGCGLLEHGWFARCDQHVVIDTRRNITVFFATRRLVSDVYAQLFLHGKTRSTAAAALPVALHGCTASLVTVPLNKTHLPSHGPSYVLGGRCRSHK